jgi:hypothetical protein
MAEVAVSNAVRRALPQDFELKGSGWTAKDEPMPATIQKPKPTHREETPVLTCRSCGCYLRSTNLSTTCSPCGTPPWEIVEDEVFERISEMSDLRQRRGAFEALIEVVG